MSDQLKHRLKVMRQMFEFAHLNLDNGEFRAFLDEANAAVGNWMWQARKEAVQKKRAEEQSGPDEVTIMTSGGDLLVVKKGDIPF